MSETIEPMWDEIEQCAGPPLVRAVDPAAVEAHRRDTYQSYESFLRARLKELDGDRPDQWQRDYSTTQAYESSIEPMRRRLRKMLGFWVGAGERTPVTMGPRETLADERD